MVLLSSTTTPHGGREVPSTDRRAEGLACLQKMIGKHDGCLPFTQALCVLPRSELPSPKTVAAIVMMISRRLMISTTHPFGDSIIIWWASGLEKDCSKSCAHILDYGEAWSHECTILDHPATVCSCLRVARTKMTTKALRVSLDSFGFAECSVRTSCSQRL